jgi:hypothetical protein
MRALGSSAMHLALLVTSAKNVGSAPFEEEDMKFDEWIYAYPRRGVVVVVGT